MHLLKSMFYWLRRVADPPAFAVTFRGGEVRCTRGELRAGWLDDCRDIAAQFGLTAGHLDGLVRDGRLLLRFSPDVPAAAHQRFRNALGVRHQARR